MPCSPGCRPATERVRWRRSTRCREPAARGIEGLTEVQFSPEFQLVRALACEAFYSDFVAPGAAGPGAWQEIDFSLAVGDPDQQRLVLSGGDGMSGALRGDRGRLRSRRRRDRRRAGRRRRAGCCCWSPARTGPPRTSCAGRRTPHTTCGGRRRSPSRRPPTKPPLILFRGHCVGGHDVDQHQSRAAPEPTRTTRNGTPPAASSATTGSRSANRTCWSTWSAWSGGWGCASATTGSSASTPSSPGSRRWGPSWSR